ncbi:vitamin B12/bleomycin/antimicrobial peptide transport system ATP-binding/permease protein [Gammaproteobacteria bacterium]
MTAIGTNVPGSEPPNSVESLPSPEIPPVPEISAFSGVFGEMLRLVRFVIKFLRFAGPYWNSKEKWKARGWTIVLVILTIIQVFMPVWLNQWNADFFNALEKKNWTSFLIEVEVLGAILVFSMAITSSHMWFKRQIQMGWRAWLTEQLLRDWMAEGRQHQVNYIPGEQHDNPDGRIAEDIRNAIEVAIDLTHSLFYCLLLLVGFTKILWSLSGEVIVNIAGSPLVIHGHLVLVALLYAVVFSSLALWLSQPLVVAAKRRLAAEAKFRFELGRARENSATIALLHGEANERRRFRSLFSGVAGMWRIQSWALTKILMFSSGYSVLTTAFPLLVAAPRYIIGVLTLGELMQTAQAFQQMIQALSWPVDNAAKVAEWRGSAERVLGLHDALENLQRYKADPKQRIVVDQSDRAALVFRHLCVAMPDGRVLLSGFNAEILQGEWVLISGDSEATAKLFKVVGGLWPWGRGRVALPKDTSIFFLPQQPYVPKGNLRAIVSYPTPSHGIDDVALVDALRRVGLGGLAHRLEESATWEQVLTLGELQRLGFARALLHKPKWIFIEEATDALNPVEEGTMMRLLQKELPGVTVLTIGYRSTLEAYHPRHLSLIEHTRISQLRSEGGGEQCGCACEPEIPPLDHPSHSQ